MTAKRDAIAAAIEYAFTSPNESDSNLETANIVDGLYRVARALRDLGNGNAATSMGGMEALGMTMKESAEIIAGALSDLAEAIRDHGSKS
mgnify:CR=1 FL=1